jgi:hypothetical protein
VVRRIGRLDERRQTFAVAALVALSCVLYAAGRSVVHSLVHNQHLSPHPDWFGAIPFWYFLQSPQYTSQFDVSAIASLQLLALLQCLVLLALYLVLRRVTPGRLSRLFIGAGAAIMLAMALGATDMSSSDLYFYIGSALAQPSAYHPDGVRFLGEQAVINRIWGLPLFPTGYGPLWIALSKIAVMTQSSLAGQLIALRLLEACALAICAALLFALTRSIALVAIVVLNPALYELYVVDGHNDLTALAFVLAAAVFRTRLWAAIPLAAAAGLVKLPFALVAMLAFSGNRRLSERLIPALASAGICAVASLVIVGPDYVTAMRVLYAVYAKPVPGLTNILHIVLALVCVVAVGLALVKRRFLNGGAWSFLALGPYFLPWYLAWGVPYAVLAEVPAISYFVTMPLANVLLATYLPASPLTEPLRWAIVAALLYVFLVRPKTQRKLNAPAA